MNWLLIILIAVLMVVAERRWPRLAWVYLAGTIASLAYKAMTHDWPAVALLVATAVGWAYYARKTLQVTS